MAVHPLPPLTAIPAHLVSAADYEAAATSHLDARAWAYLQGGAADEITLQENIEAFRQLRLLPQMLNNLRGGHTAIELFGQQMAHPIMLAPVAYQRLFHPAGELAVAQGAAAMQAGMVISAFTSMPLPEIAAQTTSPLWFQLYWQGSREASLALVQLAEANGCRGLMFTVDAPVAGVRNREQRAGFCLPPGIAAVHIENTAKTANGLPGGGGVFDTLMAAAPTWDDVAWLAGKTKLPIVLKGILHPLDVRRAIDVGAQGIVVSNHGGRVLDTVPATIELLPALKTVAGDHLKILLDGGIRRGSDVFKALALGADAVLIGRPAMHALAVAGALGVAHLLRLLREELEVTMALCGCRDIAAIDAQFLLNPP